MDHLMNRPGGGGYSYHSQASSMADEDEKKDASGSASKRQRVHFSCTECHRRKQKCNRETPCQHCIARKIPDRCKTFQPGEDPTDLGSRVTRLERSMQDNFERMFEMLQNQQQQLQHQQDQKTDRQSMATNPQVPISSTSGAQQLLSEAAGSEAGDEVLDQERSPLGHQFNPPNTMSMKIDSLLDTLSGTQGTGALTDPVRSIEGATDLDSLTQEYGMNENITKSLISILPTREICDVLVDHFFLEINWLRQPLSQRLFREIYDRFWASGPTLTPSNINNYAVLVILMAIARCSIERSDLFSEDPRAVRLMARRLFFAGRKALLVSTMLGREDIHQVMGYNMASRFLILDRRITEAWTCVANAVKTAHSIGLHRDGSKLHLSVEESEMRRRVWSAIYFTDRNLCMNLGRPTQIDDNVIDTQMPSEEDDYDVFPDMFKPASTLTLPEGTPPSPLSYTKHRHRLAVIMGKIISTYQNLHTPAHYGDIISIDKELENYRKRLPDYFRSEIRSSGELYHVDTVWDEGYPFVPVHRYLLESEVDHIRVSLHRPYLLRTNHKTGHRYEYSRRSCIAAAHHNILLRKDIIGALKEKFGEGKVPKVLHLHLGTYKTLNSLIIIGMYLIVTPDAEDAEMLLDHLRFYVNMWKKKREAKGYVRDELKDREASIIQIFLQKIEETRAEAVTGKTSKSVKVKREAEMDDTRGDVKRGKRGNAAQNGGGGGGGRGGGALAKRTTEEDTAGVLLDLNQSAREGQNLPYNEYVSTFNGGGGGNRKGSGDVPPPWPYLPMNTHHHHTPSRPPSLSNGSGPSPVNTSQSSEDGPNATTAQQLFESWFRYNAFDTMDFDTLNTTLDSAPAAPTPQQQQQQQQQKSPANFAGKGSGGFTGGDPMMVSSPAQIPVGQLSRSISNQPTTGGSYPMSGVQLSTLPAPIWNSALAMAKQSGAQGAGKQDAGGDYMAGHPTAVAGNGRGTMPSTTSAPSFGGGGVAPMPVATVGMGTNMAASGDQFNDASFDPNFWQSLIDKISS